MVCPELAFLAGACGELDPFLSGTLLAAPVAMRCVSLLLPVVVAGCNAHPLLPVALETTTESSATFCVIAPPAVDVLIVMDESRSMAEEVPWVSPGLQTIGAVYDAAETRLDFRIAVVSSQLAEDGSAPFVETSCQERLDAFTTTPDVDLRDEGCLDVCDLATLETTASSVEDDPIARARPWIEIRNGASNLPDGRAARDDLACRGALGFRGTGHRQPLAAMTRALEQSEDPNHPGFGFLRRDASLFVLFVTDGDDASEGEVDDYAGLLASIRDVKRTASPEAPRNLFVAVIGGVGPDEDLDGEHVGCASQRGIASPPIRLMQLASQFAEFPSWEARPWFSICGDPWLRAPACVPGWSPSNEPFCVDACVDADVPACEVTRTDLEPVVECELSEDGEAVIPDGVEECAVVRTESQFCASAELEIRRTRGRAEGCYRTTCPIAPRAERSCAGSDG